jgi:HTH-type transcriptional repressor of NAD biosynthesis genes
MYEIGVVPGKFFPPHRGHLMQIIRAATMCKMLYVVVSDNDDLVTQKCRKDNLPYMPIRTRALWMSLELQGIENIKVLTLDETGMPEYPDGSSIWCKALIELVPEKIDIVFGGEAEYADTYMQHLPGTEYGLFDRHNNRFSVSGTEIRNNYLQHWDFILGPARPYFARRVLIVGTESCGKTTMTKYLGKIYHTSWSEEYGRYYSKDHLGGNDLLFDLPDFERIAATQRIQDEVALRGANRICFFDTDAVVTQFYCKLYTGNQNPEVERYVDPNRYDVVVLLAPNTPWIADGQRFVNEQRERQRLHEVMYYMFLDRGFKDRIIEIQETDYSSRLNRVTEIADRLLADKNYYSRY